MKRKVRSNSTNNTRSVETVSSQKTNRSVHSLTRVLIVAKEDLEVKDLHTFHLRNASKTRRSNNSQLSSGRLAYQVKEKVVINKTQNDYSLILKEICEQIKDFNQVRFKPADTLEDYLIKRAATRKKLKLSFGSIEDIEKLKSSTDFKINIRNKLGVKNEDDWILNLNIGNVMNMTPLKFDELNNLLVLDELDKRTKFEVSKDSLLEKVVQLGVSYFCTGTEI